MWTPRTDFIDKVVALDVNESYAATLTNNSGGIRTVSHVVIFDTANDNSYTTTATEADPLVIGVVAETTINTTPGLVQYGGVCQVAVDGATTRGNWLVTSTTITQATPKATFQNGVFALALESIGGAGTIDALLMVGAFPGDNVNLDATLTIMDGNEIRFREPSGGGTDEVKLQAPALAATITFNLPPTVGAAGYFLQSDGANPATTSWGAGAVITFVETQVYDANAPNAWTDLDLSATIGSNEALVFLRIENHDGSNADYNFRQNGSARDVLQGMASTLFSDVPAGDDTHFCMKTDSGGIVEWFAGAAGIDTDVYVIAYIL